MNLDVTFRNLNPREEVRKRAHTLYKKLERFLEPAAEGHLVVSIEHAKAIVELVVSSHGLVHKITEEHDDLRTALDQLFHRFQDKLRRAKERRQEHGKHRDEGVEELSEGSGNVDDDFDDDLTLDGGV